MVATGRAAIRPVAAAPAFRPGLALRLPYPVRNVLRRWRGAVGMMLGVGIALGITMTMLGVTQASVDLYTKDFRVSGANAYVLREGGTLIPVLPSDNPGTIKNGRQTLSRIRRIPGVTTALGIMSAPIEREREGPRRSDQPAELILTAGVDGDPTSIANAFTLDQGRWLGRADEIVIGPKLAREKGLGLQQQLRLADRNFTIVGVGKMRGLGLTQPADAIAYMDFAAFRQRADAADVYSTIVVQAADPEAVRRGAREIGSLSVYSPDDLVKLAEEANAPAVGIYWVLIGLTLGVAALFVSNMLGRSVAERRLEFATLRAIGIPTSTILFTVGAEALLISVIAGAFGMGLSLGLGTLLNATLTAAYSLESLYSPSFSLFVLIAVLALVLGLVSGLFPARQATRVDPVEVLREA